MENRAHDEDLAGCRILLIAVPALGDVLLCTPLLRALRAAAGTEIDVLVRRGHAEVLEGNPDVGRIIQVDRRPSVLQHVEMSRRLFRRYDVVVSNSTSDRMALYALLLGRRRIAVVPPSDGKLPWKRWVSERYTIVDAQHCHTLITIRRLGGLLDLRIDQQITPPRAHSGHAVLTALLGPGWEHESYAIIHPAPASAYKRWHAPGWRAVVSYLKDRAMRVVLTGGPAPAELDYLNRGLGLPRDSIINLAGQLRVGDISSLLEHCSVFIGVDTVVTHMAAALGAPTVALFGPTNPVVWGPWPQGYRDSDCPFVKHGSQQVGNVYLLQGPGSCVPCSRQGCFDHPDSDSHCLQALSARDVVQAIDTLLPHAETTAANGLLERLSTGPL